MAERYDLPLDELLKLAVEHSLADVHTSVACTVKRYDSVKKRADVVLATRRRLLDEDGAPVFEDYPAIPNVPVGWPGAGGFFWHLPCEPGDTGWLFFAETDVSQWQSSGEVSEPKDATRHGLSSPIFFPTPRTPPETAGAFLACPSAFSFGDPSAALAVAVAQKVEAQLTALKSAIAGAAVVAGDGGASFKAAILAALGSWPESTAAGKLKAE